MPAHYSHRFPRDIDLAMRVFQVDSSWYEHYWLKERGPRPAGMVARNLPTIVSCLRLAFDSVASVRQARELDASVGASGPHGFAVRSGSRSSVASFRVHCIPPRVRDDRDPPLSSGETGESKELICSTAKAEYFSQRGWTGF